MTGIYRNPAAVHAPFGRYTHQIEVCEPVRWLALSGQVGANSDGTFPSGPGEQLEAAAGNVTSNLEAAQMSPADIVKLTIYMTEMIDRDSRREVLDRWLGPNRPCVTLLGVSALAHPDAVVELDAWAAAPQFGPAATGATA